MIVTAAQSVRISTAIFQLKQTCVVRLFFDTEVPIDHKQHWYRWCLQYCDFIHPSKVYFMYDYCYYCVYF